MGGWVPRWSKSGNWHSFHQEPEIILSLFESVLNIWLAFNNPCSGTVAMLVVGSDLKTHGNLSFHTTGDCWRIHLETEAWKVKHPLKQGCQTHFHWGPHQPHGCLQKAKIILGLYKYNYSLIVKELKLHLFLWRQLQGWSGPWWKWVWHPCPKERP